MMTWLQIAFQMKDRRQIRGRMIDTHAQGDKVPGTAV